MIRQPNTLRQAERVILCVTVAAVVLATACGTLAPLPPLVTALPSLTPPANPTAGPAATASLAATMPATAVEAYTPAFHAGACPFSAPAGASVTCGTLSVPQDRAGNL